MNSLPPLFIAQCKFFLVYIVNWWEGLQNKLIFKNSLISNKRLAWMNQTIELTLMNWKYASFFPWSFPAFSFVAQWQLNCMLTTLVEHLLLTMKIKHSHMYVMSFCFVNSSSIEVPSFSSRWIPDCSAEVLEKRIRLLKQIILLQNFERWEDEWYEPFLPVWILQNVGISLAQFIRLVRHFFVVAPHHL